MKRYIAVLVFLIFSLNIAEAQDTASIADVFPVGDVFEKPSANEAEAGEDFSTSITPTGPVIPKTWLRVGIGGAKNRIFLGGNLFFRVAGPLALGFRGGAAFEVDLFAHPGENFWEITPAVSYTPLGGSRGMVSVIAGAGLTGGSQRGEFLERQAIVVEEYEKITFRRFCAAFELQAAVFIPGANGLALAASVFTNQNSERPFSGYHIGILFGERR